MVVRRHDAVEDGVQVRWRGHRPRAGMGPHPFCPRQALCVRQLGWRGNLPRAADVADPGHPRGRARRRRLGRVQAQHRRLPGW